MIVFHTNVGDLTIEVFQDKAPKTVANFIQYCKEGFYNNTIFHRVIDGFMIQGGGFEPDMKEKKTRVPINNEADNGLKNSCGTLAMARTADPHSATTQFFINVADNNFLNYQSPDLNGWGYCVFAKIVKGMDVVNSIKRVKTGRKGIHSDVPLVAVIVQNVTVEND